MLIIFRNSSSEIRQLLKNDTFMGDLINRKDQTDALTSSKLGGYSQALQEQFDADSRSICTRTSADASCFSFRSGQSELYSVLDGDTASVISKSQLTRPQSGKTKKISRGH